MNILYVQIFFIRIYAEFEAEGHYGKSNTALMGCSSVSSSLHLSRLPLPIFARLLYSSTSTALPNDQNPKPNHHRMRPPPPQNHLPSGFHRDGENRSPPNPPLLI